MVLGKPFMGFFFSIFQKKLRQRFFHKKPKERVKMQFIIAHFGVKNSADYYLNAKIKRKIIDF